MKQSKSDLDQPLTIMVRSGGKLVPKYNSDAGPNDPIVPMKDYGRGLQAVPDNDRSPYNFDKSPANKKGNRYSK